MFITLASDLSEGFAIIGLISLMTLVVCPLFVWILASDFPSAHPSKP